MNQEKVNERKENILKEKEYTREVLAEILATKIEKKIEDDAYISMLVDKMLNSENEFDMKRFYNRLKFVLSLESDRFKTSDDWSGTLSEIFLPEEMHKMENNKRYMYRDKNKDCMVKLVDGVFYEVLKYDENAPLGEEIIKLSDIKGANIRYCRGMDF